MRFPKINVKIEGRKGKEQTASSGVYKNVEVEDAEGDNFSTQSKTLHLEQ